MSRNLLLSPVSGLFVLGLIIRVIFLLFGAEIYFGRTDFFIDGDTSMYVRPIVSLIENGVYTFNIDHPDGFFIRTPGYPFFISIFYLLSGRDLDLMYQLIIWSQVLIDSCSILIIYRLGERLFDSKRVGLLLGFIYALYPFVIVWNPVVYAESTSIFFLLLSLMFFVERKSEKSIFISGILIAVAFLFRPQIALIAPCFVLVIIYEHRAYLMAAGRPLLFFLVGLCLVYLPWPMRNYFAHDKLVLAHNYDSVITWNKDVVAFWTYIFALKAEWEPQFSGITHNRTVDYPKEAYLVPGDSLKLEKVLALCKTCGSGFSNWRGYWKERITNENCDAQIKTLFDELTANQIQFNSTNYYVTVPLKNLKKAIFKSNLYNEGSLVRQFASLLFYYRTLLIILGVIGCVRMISSNKSDRSTIGLLILSYIVITYGYMCWMHRNIEIRYFLPTDILLLIPAGYISSRLYAKLYSKNGGR